MIKLTRSNDRDVWVEPSAIVMVESDGMKTTVTLAHGSILLVKESVEDVLKAKRGIEPGTITWVSDEEFPGVVDRAMNRLSGFVK
jgi:uncharacterized protein YlzI (FlbEa/FlbD family)